VCIPIFMGAGVFVLMYILLKHSVLKFFIIGVRSEVVRLVTVEDSCLLEYGTTYSRRPCCLHHHNDSLPWYGGSRFIWSVRSQVLDSFMSHHRRQYSLTAWMFSLKKPDLTLECELLYSSDLWNDCNYELQGMYVEVDHLRMWKKGKLYGSAVLLLEELHFMMTCSKLQTKCLVLEQVLERLLLLLLPSFCNVKLTLIVPFVVNCCCCCWFFFFFFFFFFWGVLNLSIHLGLVIIFMSYVMVDL